MIEELQIGYDRVAAILPIPHSTLSYHDERFAMNYQYLTLPQIYDEAEVIASDAKAHFGHLNSRQLNWKPAADSWSVAQCLDHLISINSEYYPTFNRILNGEHRRALMHRLPFLPAMFGRMMGQCAFAEISAEVQSARLGAALLKLH